MAIINQSYVRDEGRCFGPVYFPGETYSFYINFDSPISDLDFANMVLQIRKAQGGTLVHTYAAGTLKKDEINSYYYNIYADFVIPALPFGQYQFAIYDSVAAVTKVVSNIILIEESDVVTNTALIEYRHSSNIYGIRYEELPTFKNIFRLPLIQTGFAIETERKQYRNVTNRRLRNLKSYKDEVVRIESYLFDEDGHKAIAAAYDHDSILLDGIRVTPKDVYTIEERKESVLSKGTISAIVDETSGLSVAGSTSVSSIPGEFSNEFN